MADPIQATSDGVNMINATMTGLNMIAATVLGAIGVRTAREQKAKRDDEEKRDESRATIREMADAVKATAHKVDGLVDSAARVETKVAVLDSKVVSLDAQTAELFKQAREAGQNASTALALIGQRNMQYTNAHGGSAHE
jgi:maltose-binding protein MalE